MNTHISLDNRRSIIKSVCTLFFLLIVLTTLFLFGKYKNFFHRASDSAIVPLDNGSSQQPPYNNLGNFYLSINKINVITPIILGVDPANKTKYNEALKEGVALMPGTAMPGLGSGNIFIYGHSGPERLTRFEKIFSHLNDLQNGDEIDLFYLGKKHEYFVKGKKVVEKDDFSVIGQTKTEQLTLMTCWPIGTKDKRLIVIATKSI